LRISAFFTFRLVEIDTAALANTVQLLSVPVAVVTVAGPRHGDMGKREKELERRCNKKNLVSILYFESSRDGGAREAHSNVMNTDHLKDPSVQPPTAVK
jgi:hypothetical protein